MQLAFPVSYRCLRVPDAPAGYPEATSEVTFSVLLSRVIGGGENATSLASIAQSAPRVVKEIKDRLVIPKPTDLEAIKTWRDGELKNELRPTQFDRTRFESICLSPAGRAAIEAATQAVISIVTIGPEKTSPGHDLRHLIKDALVGTKAAFCDEKLIESPAQAFVVGVASLLHDSGRLVEKTINGTVAGGIKGDQHAEYSALLMKEVINAFMQKALSEKMPNAEIMLCAKIWDEALLAVINHQSGAGKESWVCQAVSSADRAQLVGPEGLLRFIQHDVFLEGASLFPNNNPLNETTISLPGAGKETGNYDLLTHALFYATYLFPSIPGVVEKMTEAGKDFTALALLSATLSDLSDPRKLIETTSFKELREKHPDFTQVFAPNIAKLKGEKLETCKADKRLPHRGFPEERFDRVCMLAQKLPPLYVYGEQGLDRLNAINSLHSLLTTTAMVSTCYDSSPAELYKKIVDKVEVLTIDQVHRLTRTCALIAQGLKDSDEESRGLAEESAQRKDPLSVMFSRVLRTVSCNK